MVGSSSMKVVLIVIDSFGIGALPDATRFGDEGSNTYLNIKKRYNFTLPNLERLGLNNIDGINLSDDEVLGNYGRMAELTNAKDTTAGHYEMCGLVLSNPYPTFPSGFPDDLMTKIKNETGFEFLGNVVASGTEIIKRLGNEHLKTKKPIIYTSADSVLQIASHTDVLSLENLYALCIKIRGICSGKYNVGRIIARPFATDSKGEFYRIEARKDFALSPPKPTMLDKLKANGNDVIGIGKIKDIFCGSGITESYHTKNNVDGIKEIIKQVARRDVNGLIFANLNDTDMLFGHRNDYVGYAEALKEFDKALPEIMNNLSDDDILIVTADHGCDPTTESTDHSREYVPLLVYGKSLKQNVNLGTITGFNCVSTAVLSQFDVERKANIFDLLK